MKLTTKARYTVEALASLSTLTNGKDKYISLVEVSEDTGISISYLEQLFVKLRKNNVVSSTKGPTGGYKLIKKVEDLSILEIINAVDEDLETRSCGGKLSCLGENRCKCNSHDLWHELLDKINYYLDNKKLSDIVTITKD